MNNNLPIITESDLYTRRIGFISYRLNFKLTNDIKVTRTNHKRRTPTNTIVYGTEVMFNNKLYILIRCDWFNGDTRNPQASSKFDYSINDKKINIIDIYTLKYPNMFIFRYTL